MKKNIVVLEKPVTTSTGGDANYACAFCNPIIKTE